MAVTLTGSATDPGSADTSAGFAWAWNVTKVHGTATTATFASGTSSTLKFTPDNSGTYIVTLQATDHDGQQSPAVSQTIVVSDTAPTVSIAGPSTDGAGTAVTLTGSATDPAGAVMSAGFSFAWDVTKVHGGTTNTTFATGNGTGTTTVLSFTPDNSGTYTVTLVATDKNGGSNTPPASFTINVTDPATASISGPTVDQAGTAVTFTGSATDPSPADTHAGYSFSWTVTKVHGTATTASFATGSGTGLVFTPDDTGTYTVS